MSGDRREIDQRPFDTRAKRPWIIVYAHHPMYCSNSGEYCVLDAPVVQEALEGILMQYGVRIYIQPYITVRQVDLLMELGAHFI